MKHRILAMILALLIAFGATHMAFAAETPSDSTEISEECKERVYEEVLTGNITNHFDVLKVAVSQLPATAAYSTNSDNNEEDELVIRQKLDSVIKPDGSIETTYAATTLLVVDQNGNKASATSVLLYVGHIEHSGGINEYSVYATHTMYLKVRSADPDNMFAQLFLQLDRITTKLTYGTAIGAASLVQDYEVFYALLADENKHLTKTYSNPSAKTYTWQPDNDVYAVPVFVGSYIKTECHVYVGTKVLRIICQEFIDAVQFPNLET